MRECAISVPGGTSPSGLGSLEALQVDTPHLGYARAHLARGVP